MYYFSSSNTQTVVPSRCRFQSNHITNTQVEVPLVGVHWGTGCIKEEARQSATEGRVGWRTKNSKQQGQPGRGERERAIALSDSNGTEKARKREREKKTRHGNGCQWRQLTGVNLNGLLHSVVLRERLNSWLDAWATSRLAAIRSSPSQARERVSLVCSTLGVVDREGREYSERINWHQSTRKGQRKEERGEVEENTREAKVHIHLHKLT